MGAMTHDEPHDQPGQSIKERAAQASADTTAMLNQQYDTGTPTDRARLASGTVSGVHYLQTVETVKQLKRDGRLEEALTVVMAGVLGAEQSAAANPFDRRIPPWYTEHAAIILRKLGRRDEEIAVLRRWMEAAPDTQKAGSKIESRLAGLLALEQ